MCLFKNCKWWQKVVLDVGATTTATTADLIPHCQATYHI